MEDFRLLHERFPQMSMLCIEADGEVIPRQRFNKPHSLVRFVERATKSDEWISDWRPDRPALLWFDYASKKERSAQFSEFQSLLRKSPDKTVLRVTMNADLPKEEGRKTAKQQFESFSTTFGDLIPEDIDDAAMNSTDFPAVLARMFEIAADQVLGPAGERQFTPLLLTAYRDTNHMLTVTGVVDRVGAGQSLASECGLRDWPYFATNWSRLQRINMPDLTVKERIYINEMLPTNIVAADIQRALGFQLDERLELSLEKLRNYTEFYRHFPQFIRGAF